MHMCSYKRTARGPDGSGPLQTEAWSISLRVKYRSQTQRMCAYPGLFRQAPRSERATEPEREMYKEIDMRKKNHSNRDIHITLHEFTKHEDPSLSHTHIYISMYAYTRTCPMPAEVRGVVVAMWSSRSPARGPRPGRTERRVLRSATLVAGCR